MTMAVALMKTDLNQVFNEVEDAQEDAQRKTSGGADCRGAGRGGQRTDRSGTA